MSFIKKLDIQNKKTVILFFCFVFLFYGFTLKNKYALDDDYITVTNFPIKGQTYVPNHLLVKEGFSGIPKIWTSRYAHDSEGAFDYRPVVTTTFAIEYGIFGQNPFISHLINLLLYFLTIWTLYCCLLKILKDNVLRFEITFITCLLFLIHPIHTEVVASLKSRDEILSLLFSLLFFYQCIEWTETKNIKCILLAIIYIFLGYFSKISAMLFFVAVPLAFVIYKKIDLKKIVALGIFSGILFILFGLFRKSIITEKEVRNFYHFENPLFTEKASYTDKFFIGLKTLGFYIKMLVFPYRLKFYYGVNTFDFISKINIYFFISLTFISASVFYFFKSKSKDLLFAFLIFIGFSFPFLNVMTPVAGILGERLAYFSSIGFCLMLGILIAPFYQNFKLKNSFDALKKPAIYLTGITFICFIYVNQRNSKWYNKITLLENDIPYLDKSSKANSLIANDYFEMLRSPNKKYSNEVLIQKCLKHYNLAVANDSSFFSAYNNAGVVYYSYLNNISSAKKYFTLAIRHKPMYAQAYENLGNCFKREKNLTKALFCYKKSIEINPNQYSAYMTIITTFFDEQQYDKSLKVIKIAHHFFPNNYALIAQEANCLFLKKDTTIALRKYEEAYQLNPNHELAQFLFQKYAEFGDLIKTEYYKNK